MSVSDAVKAALLTAGVVAELGGRPKAATAPGYAKPFVVIWPDAPVRTPSKLSNPLGTETTVLVCHCAGLTVDAAQIAERALFAAVTGLYRQTIDGRVVDRMPVPGSAEPLRRDDTVSPSLYDLPAEWRIWTSPA